MGWGWGGSDAGMHAPQVQSEHRIDYRPDIDGLRAVAVVAVVLFHARLGFPGGYIGVDVFFVISGYLITQQLLDAYQAGRASILDFYARRAKRILPALTAVYLACLVIGSIVLLPPDMRDLGRSLAASTVFVSNIFFYTQSGYFDGPSYEKPLLHTWSLSVPVSRKQKHESSFLACRCSWLSIDRPVSPGAKQACGVLFARFARVGTSGWRPSGRDAG